MPTVTFLREETDRLAYTALVALRDLRALAARAVTVDDALFIHARSTELYDAAIGAVDTAIETADTLLRRT